MKTFRAYLLSYLGTLFLPIIVLSAVIFQIIFQYGSMQIIERNQMALEQLRAAVAMQTTQLGAYALQTTQRGEFSERQLSQTASFYNVEQALTQWQMTNAFTDGIFFYANSISSRGRRSSFPAGGRPGARTKTGRCFTASPRA
ncbi:MAG TPA: hypothetical protein PKE04_00215 [Clostridia bacterium]|nr:hypothetical protein [Clostridia bacterium]